MKPVELVLAYQYRDYGLGLGGKIPWDSPEDLRHFRQLTTATQQPLDHRNAVIMGKATYDSLPGGQPLPGRLNIVMTQLASGVTVVNDSLWLSDNYDRVLERLDTDPTIEKIFVIGGGKFTTSG